MSDNRSSGSSTTTIVMVIVVAALICFPCAGVVVFGALGMILFTAGESRREMEMRAQEAQQPPLEINWSTEDPKPGLEALEESLKESHTLDPMPLESPPTINESAIQELPATPAETPPPAPGS